ncbi:MAG: DoxX family membrane protein [Acetobacteraceae bacterium]|nr:DoxX family membrane protein [Acetobacteraceae bacterium]
MIYALLGAAFAVAGADKLRGNEDYEDMFDELGWSREGMNAVAAAEIGGGALLALRSTRRLGAAVLAATSATMLASELQHNRTKLAGPRGFLLAAALIALIAPGRA